MHPTISCRPIWPGLAAAFSVTPKPSTRSVRPRRRRCDMNPLVVQGAAQLLLGRYKSEKGMFMKNILTMAATGLVIFAGLGWYLDWYKVARTTAPDGKQHIDIE